MTLGNSVSHNNELQTGRRCDLILTALQCVISTKLQTDRLPQRVFTWSAQSAAEKEKKKKTLPRQPQYVTTYSANRTAESKHPAKMC